MVSLLAGNDDPPGKGVNPDYIVSLDLQFGDGVRRAELDHGTPGGRRVGPNGFRKRRVNRRAGLSKNL